jgi:hypothetical protein
VVFFSSSGVPTTEYPFACVLQNESQGGFDITIEKGGGCCYTAEFSNKYYEVWETITWCVADCIPVPIEDRSWGAIKTLYEQPISSDRHLTIARRTR